MKPLETLRALGPGGEAPAEAKQRVYSALMASLGAAAAASAAATVVQPRPLAPLVGSWLAGVSNAKILAVAAGIWLVGGATGAALYGALHPQGVRIVYLDRPLLPTSLAAPKMESAPTAPPASSAPASAALSPSAERKAAIFASKSSQLSRERALLDLARASAARGEPALSLQQTELHRSQFLHGKLAEEREALAIRALLSLGRSDEARARAQVFRLAYPDSFLTPAIDAALSAP